MNYLTKNKDWKINKDYNKEKLLYLLIDRPNDIILDTLFWKNNENYWHRDYDLPAIVYYDGETTWYKNNKLYYIIL